PRLRVYTEIAGDAIT
ncbi:hypothetical protein, partial [Clostridioides difficile]